MRGHRGSRAFVPFFLAADSSQGSFSRAEESGTLAPPQRGALSSVGSLFEDLSMAEQEGRSF